MPKCNGLFKTWSKTGRIFSRLSHSDSHCNSSQVCHSWSCRNLLSAEMFLKMCPYDIGWSCLSKLSGDMSTKCTTNRCKSLCHSLQTDIKLCEQCSHGPKWASASQLACSPSHWGLLSQYPAVSSEPMCWQNIMYRHLLPEKQPPQVPEPRVSPDSHLQHQTFCFPWRWNLAGFPH